MKSNHLAVAFITALMLLPVAGGADPHMMQNLSETKWGPAPPSLPAGAKIAVLQGDPGATGMYTLRLSLPANYRIPAHSHPGDELVTVLAGTLYAAAGDKLDVKGGKALGVGGFALMPAGMNHYAYTKKPATILLHGMGPLEIKYVNPADDPRNAPKK